MNNILKIAVMLTAYDGMSRTIQEAVRVSKTQLEELQRTATKKGAQSLGLIGGGAAGLNTLKNLTDSYGDLQQAQLDLESVLLRDTGKADKSLLGNLNGLSEKLGNRLPGTSADIENMFKTMIELGEKGEEVFKGTGEAAAYLAIATNGAYLETAEIAVKLKEATGVKDTEMGGFLDMIARTKNLGVSMQEMQYAFSRSAGGLKLLGLQGLDSSKSLSILYASLVKAGQSGETIGTGMTKIFRAFLDKDKMSALNAEAGKYGIVMDFVDQKTGKFKGVENMIVQFDKLKNLNSLEKGAITKAFLGDGADAAFMDLMVANGVAGFEKMTRAAESQATMFQKVDLKLNGLNAQTEMLDGTWTNFKAMLGEQLFPILSKLLKGLNSFLTSVQAFTKEHPKLAKAVLLFIAFGSVAAIIAGVVIGVQALTAAIGALGIATMLTPIGWIIGAIALLAVLVTYWDDIVNGIKNVIKKFGPEVLFLFLSPVWALPVMMFKAGKKIVEMIGLGIKEGAMAPVNAIMDTVKKMREYLPFSPAKRGPFMDLHKIKIVETIASAIKPAPLTKRLSSVMNEAAGVTMRPGGGFGGGFGGGPVFNFGDTIINVPAGTPESMSSMFSRLLQENREEMVKVISEVLRTQNRGKY